MQRWIQVVVLGVLIGNATAAAGAGLQWLAWPNKAEELQYHSCGCADACWVAEVKRKAHPRQRQARLRCDCEKLYATAGGAAPEYLVADSCAAFEGEDKFSAIPGAMQRLVSEPCASASWSSASSPAGCLAQRVLRGRALQP